MEQIEIMMMDVVLYVKLQLHDSVVLRIEQLFKLMNEDLVTLYQKLVVDCVIPEQ